MMNNGYRVEKAYTRNGHGGMIAATLNNRHGTYCTLTIKEINRFFTAKKKILIPKLVKELLANGKVKLTGCHSEKTGRNYDCTVMMEDKGEGFVNFKMEF